METLNGIKRAVANDGDALGAYAGIYSAFRDAGFSICLNSKPDWVNENHIEIFVR